MRSRIDSCPLNPATNTKRRRNGPMNRILDVEHGTFTPLVFSTSGSMGRLARTFYARLAHLLSIKRQTRYADIRGHTTHTTHTPICFNPHTLESTCLQPSRIAKDSTLIDLWVVWGSDINSLSLFISIESTIHTTIH